MREAVQLVIVHHANQYLVTDGYDNRDGISKIAEGYATVLGLHQKYKIPFYLHLSGTLIETLAWSQSALLLQVKEMRKHGLLQLIGGTYSENIMTCFNADYNRRQIREYFHVFEKHLGQSQDLSWFWVPERVWDGENLASLIQDSSLPNAGYNSVLLDRRILFPVECKNLKRSDVDAKGPWIAASDPGKKGEVSLSQTLQELSDQNRKDYLQSYQIRPLTPKLEMLPISEHLRYWIPPRGREDFGRMQEYSQTLLENQGDEKILIYADDLERVAGVGGWDKTSPGRYENFLQWLKSGEASLTPVHLDQKKIRGPKASVEKGSFFELAQKFGAGEDYRGWSEKSGNREAKIFLDSSVQALEDLNPDDYDADLLDLSWKHVLASGYETFWQDEHHAQAKTSPWALALASHSRQVHVILEAAKWFRQKSRPLKFENRDIDGDGQGELILKNDQLYAVISAQCGARLVWLFWRDGEHGKLMVGNPTDDWNFLSDLNSYMDSPANHPGSFSDKGGECDHYQIHIQSEDENKICLALENRSRPGLTKIFSLEQGQGGLEVSYRFASPAKEEEAREIKFGFSPDYLKLLREGRECLQSFLEADCFLAAAGNAAIELKMAGSGKTKFLPGEEFGHGLGIRIEIFGDISFHLACRKLKEVNG